MYQSVVVFSGNGLNVEGELLVEALDKPHLKSTVYPLGANKERVADLKKREEDSMKRGEDEEKEWSKFQSDFASLMEASEQQLEREQAIAARLDMDQLREELMVSVIASLSSSLMAAVEGSSDGSAPGRRSPVGAGADEGEGAGWPVGTEGSGSSVRDSHWTGSHATMNGNRGAHKHGLLQSSRFERLSESELDRALEAIKEEGSREGSVSPVTATTVPKEQG